MKHNSGDFRAVLDMLKYFYANINYAGKIQRVEDQITLTAILNDLFNEKIVFAAELPLDYDSSHFGFPADNADFLNFADQNIPNHDPYSIFGFNWNVESNLHRKEMFTIMDKIYNLEKKKAGGGADVGAEDNQNTNIEMNSLKTSLRSSHSESGQSVEKMLKND